MTAVHEYWFLFFFSTVISSPSYSWWWSNRENFEMHFFIFPTSPSLFQKEFLNLKGISQQAKTVSIKKFLLWKVSPIFYEFFFFSSMAMKCNEFFGYSSPCWSCKVCKKSFVWFWKMSGEQSCLLYHVRCSLKFGGGRPAAGVLWTKKNWRTVSLFSNDGCVLGTQTLTNSIRSRLLPNCPLAKNRNRTSRAAAEEPEEEQRTSSFAHYCIFC